MIDKKWLIRITNEDNLWYDSEKKEYRYRIYCPNCGKVSGCLCYRNLDDVENDIFDDVGFCCSSKCSLLFGDWDDLDITMEYLGIQKDVSELTEEEASLICDELLHDADFDLPVGKLCKS